MLKRGLQWVGEDLARLRCMAAHVAVQEGADVNLPDEVRSHPLTPHSAGCTHYVRSGAAESPLLKSRRAHQLSWLSQVVTLWALPASTPIEIGTAGGAAAQVGSTALQEATAAGNVMLTRMLVRALLPLMHE